MSKYSDLAEKLLLNKNFNIIEWISVDIGMPHIGSDVLVYTPGAINGKIDVQSVYRSGTYPTFQQGWRKGEGFEITHWAKLPKNPK